MKIFSINKNITTSLNFFWLAGLLVAAIAFQGLLNARQTGAVEQHNKQQCIEIQSKRSIESLRRIGKKAIDRRKEPFEKRLTEQKISKRYEVLNKQIALANKALAKNGSSVRVDSPKPNKHQVLQDRQNILVQLNEEEKVLKDSGATIEQLAKSNCEVRWDLRSLSYVGRKMRAQMNNDVLSVQNAIAKAYWNASKDKPKGAKNPAIFHKKIAEKQSLIDRLVVPKQGAVTVAKFNPNDETVVAGVKAVRAEQFFANHVFKPQKKIFKEIVNNKRLLRKNLSPPVPKPKNRKGKYVQLPASPNNQLYYMYGYGTNTGSGGKTPPSERFGKLALVKLFQDVAVRFHQKYPEAKLVAGDLNAGKGQHQTHNVGLAIDVYAQNHLAADMRGKHRNKKSVERSIALGKMFMDSKKIDYILYNDRPVIRKVNAYARRNKLPGQMQASNSTHEYHMHVRIK